MFHSTHLILPADANWRETICRGDIVLFRFPLSEDGDLRPKRRPCLVLEIGRISGETYLDIAYGTNAMTRANKGYEIRVFQRADLCASSLRKPTRFIGARRISIPLTHRGFSKASGSPIVGHLAPALHERFNAVRARIHAESDIAADRRDEQRRELRDRIAPTLPRMTSSLKGDVGAASRAVSR